MAKRRAHRNRGAAPARRGAVRRSAVGPGRPPDHLLDSAILGAALKLLAEVGYERLSIEEVARRASTAKTSIYRRWPTKEAMVLAAVRLYIPASSATAAPAPVADSGSLRGDLLAHAKRLAALLTRERASILAGLLLAMRTQPELADAVRGQLIEREVSAVGSILDRAARRGEVSSDRPISTLALVLPSLLFTRLLVFDDPLDHAFLTRLVDDVLVPAFRRT